MIKLAEFGGGQYRIPCRAKHSSFLPIRGPWNPVREQDGSCRGMIGYRWRRKGTPACSITVSVTEGEGRLASSIDYTNSSPRHSSERPIRDTLTCSRENETFHSVACTPSIGPFLLSRISVHARPRRRQLCLPTGNCATR